MRLSLRATMIIHHYWRNAPRPQNRWWSDAVRQNSGLISKSFEAEPAHPLTSYEEPLLGDANVEVDAKGASSGLWSNRRALLREKAATLSQIVASAHRFLRYAFLASRNLMYSRSIAAWASALTLKVSMWSRSLHPGCSLTRVSRGRMELNSALMWIPVHIS